MKMTKAEYERKLTQLQKELEDLKQLEGSFVDPVNLPDFEVKRRKKKGRTDDDEFFTTSTINGSTGAAQSFRRAVKNLFCSPKDQAQDTVNPDRGLLADSVYDETSFLEVRSFGKYGNLGFYLGDDDKWIVAKDNHGSYVLTTKQNVKAVKSGYSNSESQD